MLDRIFLVRHGRSTANDDINVYKTTADHAVPLSENGVAQADRAGEFLSRYLIDNVLLESTKIRLWTSPYNRTRQTSDGIMKHCGSLVESRHEHINLCEQQFGLFDGIPDEELSLRYPEEYKHYQLCQEHEGRFWARMPMGESRFDVAVRVHQAFGTFHRDCDKHDVRNVIIVGHGVTIRAFIMQWLHLTPEWFDNELNPKNCSIRLIEKNVDKGYIYSGE